MTLAKEELERYDRQIRLIGIEGQERLKKSKVLVVGIGGLGSPAALYLAAAGVGEIVLVDSERVEPSNLNRQVLHWTRDIGELKVKSASEKLRELNPNVKIRAYSELADERLLEEVVPQVDVVIDGLDNWSTRFALNRVCVKYKKPLVHAGVYGVYGQALLVVPGITPCLQCIVVKEPPTQRPFPILGPVPGLMAMIQVMEAIKILTGYGRPALNKLIVFNGYSMEFQEISVYRNPSCPVCSKLGNEVT